MTTQVIHVIAPAAVGGAESALVALASRAADRWHVVALLQDRTRDEFLDRLRSAGVRTTALRCGRRRYLSEVRELEGVLRYEAPSVVHTHVYHADCVGYLAARRTRIPVVSTVHGFTGGDWKNRLYQWLDLRILRHFDAVVGVSPSVCRTMWRAGVPPNRTHLIPNGAADSRPVERGQARISLDLPRGELIVGWVGRFTPEKGADLFVEAMVRLGPGVIGAMVGDGPQRQLLGRCSQGVQILGPRPDIARMLQAFDLLVMSSRTEGTPMVLMEAMEAGVPIVAFAVGGIPDVLDETCAWLVPAGDTDALARAIRAALDDPAERERRAERASARLRTRFGGAAWLNAVEAVYASVVTPRGMSPGSVAACQ